MEIARRLGAEMAEIVAQMGEPERKKEHTSFWLYTHTWRRLYFLVSHGNKWQWKCGMWHAWRELIKQIRELMGE